MVFLCLLAELSLAKPPIVNHHYPQRISAYQSYSYSRMEQGDCEIIVWKEPPAKDGLNGKQRRKEAKRAKGLASGKHSSSTLYSTASASKRCVYPSAHLVSCHAPMKPYAHESRSEVFRTGSEGTSEQAT